MTKTITCFLLLLCCCACGNEKPGPVAPAPSPQDTLAPPPASDTAAASPDPGEEIPESPAPEDKDIAGPQTNPKSGAGAGRPAAMPAPAPAKPVSPVPSDAGSFAKKGFSDVAALDASIRLDIRYATANNFTKTKIYDCPRCLLRPEAASALVKAHQALQKKGYGLKMFDCYRPRPYQQRLWDKVPNPDYVTPPVKGSMHSRGAAVDLTVVDKNGKELDMGTPYDFFGREAHTDNTNLPAAVLANRKLLRDALEDVGFKGIRTEWWHFSFQGKNHPLSDYVWPCDEKK
jgi:D-alanyl-D-alanine dipeptidase